MKQLAVMIILIAVWQVGYAQQNRMQSADSLVIDDFQDYSVGEIASDWMYIDKSGEKIATAKALEEGERFHIREENGNRYLHVETRNESIRLTQVNGDDFDWNIQEYPYLQWRWRAQHLPLGASEDDQNDSGGAIYVTFDTDWLGRPKSIKYAYSSALPEGTSISFGALKLIVVSTRSDDPVGEWVTVERNLLKDFKEMFGGFLRPETPPDRPLSITIWSDSDTTSDSSKVDIDDIMLLRSPSEM